MPWFPILTLTYGPPLRASTGFCKFSDKKEVVWGFLFRKSLHSRKNCNSSGPILRNNAEIQMEILPQLLAILSSLQGYEANRGMGARRGTAGSGSSLWAEGFGLRAKAGDKNETDMHNTGDNILNSDQRVSIGINLV